MEVEGKRGYAARKDLPRSDDGKKRKSIDERGGHDTMVGGHVHVVIVRNCTTEKRSLRGGKLDHGSIFEYREADQSLISDKGGLGGKASRQGG